MEPVYENANWIWNRPILGTVSCKTINNKTNTKIMFKKIKSSIDFKMYWDIIASIRACTWLTPTIKLNKFISNLIIAQCKNPLKFQISACHCSMSTCIIPRYE